MKQQSAYEKARDQKIADEVALPVDRALMCSAHGCPLRWSMSGDRGRACSRHYWAEPREWPRITQWIIDAETERARYAQASRPLAEPIEPEVRKAAVAALQSFAEQHAADPLAWARELHRRHRAGERLSEDKVDAYRRVLRLDPTPPQANDAR
jgi:hypothetical protein